MPDTPFPRERVAITDPTSILPLPADKKAFVHFNFHIIPESPNCPVINRIVLGQNRDAVGQFHQANLNNIPTVKRTSGTSRLGFGHVIVVDAQAEKIFDQEDTLIMIANEVPDPETMAATQVATRIAIAKNSPDLDEPDETLFVDLQANCQKTLTPAGKHGLADAMKTAT